MDSFKIFDVNDGEVNIECDQYNDDGSEKKELNVSTDFATDNFLTQKTDDSLQEKIGYESEVVSEEPGNKNTFIYDDAQNLDMDYENLDNPFEVSNYISENFVNDDIVSGISPSSTLETQQTIPLKNEENEINDSKNVPKGMMKAFAHMVLEKDPKTVKILRGYFERSGESFEKFKERMKKIRKSSKINIGEIKVMLIDDEFACTMRKIGCYFLRKRFLSHIFNSKMQKRHIHMKYIPRWLEILKNPCEFTSLK